TGYWYFGILDWRFCRKAQLAISLRHNSIEKNKCSQGVISQLDLAHMPGKVATRWTLVLLQHESGIVCDRQLMRAFSDTKVGPLHLAMPVIRRILHSSDFSEASLIAFAHALKAALIG